MKIEKYCIKQHQKTNHYYDEYLPYEFHLRMVVNVAEKYSFLLDDKKDYVTGKTREETSPFDRHEFITLREACIRAAWGHDLIEDTRTSFNDVKEQLGIEAAEIVFAVTNEKGKTRKDRANKKYYDGIRATPGAVFVKLCDRIANVQYSKMTSSRMYGKYNEENPNFIKSLGFKPNHPYKIMFNELNELLNG